MLGRACWWLGRVQTKGCSLFSIMPTFSSGPSLRSLPGRFFDEPWFAAASIRFADAVADELIRSAEASRSEWIRLAEGHTADIKRLADNASYATGNLLRLPLVRDFLAIWIREIRWPVVATYSDGIQLEPPPGAIRDLRSASSVANMEFYLAALSDVCCCRLGSNDHDCDYGLYLNVPIWIPLAVVPQFSDSFARQLRMVIHHEMGHFRWRGGVLRAEHIAHARGVAVLSDREWPASPTILQALLEKEHPEAWSNEEIRSLVLGTRGGTRLIRAWGERRRRLQRAVDGGFLDR